MAKGRLRTTSGPWVWGHCGVRGEENGGVGQRGGTVKKLLHFSGPNSLSVKCKDNTSSFPWGCSEDEMNRDGYSSYSKARCVSAAVMMSDSTRFAVVIVVIMAIVY